MVAGGLVAAMRSITVEPIMLLDGACKEAMLIFIENVQMNKICSVSLGLSPEICANLTNHKEESVLVQREFSLFTFYNSIIMSVLPLIFVLFMGAWSDKYGRKFPLLMTLVGHAMYAGGYLLANWQTSWPVEVLYLVTLLEALGGANVGILSSTISYISDISSEKQRTSRIGTINSMWYLGAPIGTLTGALIIKYSGYDMALGLVLLAYVASIVYVIVFIEESHGPFAKKALQAQGSLKDVPTMDKKDVRAITMLTDFFNWRHVVESFKTAFKKREGDARSVLMAVIIGNMIRRMARGFFMYMFVRRALHWGATDYGYWISYRNLLVALGSLFLVPFLTRLLSFTDMSLVVLGTLSMIFEYLCYGLVIGPSQTFLMWLGPPAGIISNVMAIAFRSMSTKLVTKQEKGRINAVMAALNGLMPMLGYACYSPIYYNTVDVWPAAQFFFAAGLNAIIIVLFIIIQVRQSSPISPEDLEVAPEKEDKDGPGNSKTLTLSHSLSSPGKSRDSHKCNDSPTLQQLSYAKKNTKELTSSLPPVPSECYSVGDCANTDNANFTSRVKHSPSVNGYMTKKNSDVDDPSADIGQFTPRTNQQGTKEERPPGIWYRGDEKEAGCYSSRFSDAEITASEKTD